MIARLVREKREQMMYTQQELSDLSNISLRSIQRIEKGDVVPRMQTLKILADTLEISLDEEGETPNSGDNLERGGVIRKVVLTVLVMLMMIALAMAFLAQSGTFPETEFEFLIYWAGILGLLSLLLLFLWKRM